MDYLSTRGATAPIPFSAAVLEGLARDGGLLVPSGIPDVGELLDGWRALDYPALAVEIFRLFVGDELPTETLRGMVERAYRSFRHAEVTPLTPLDQRYLLELFHGPTFAFKDLALQFLGNLFEVLLAPRGRDLNILGATSGDTGSAAIHGVRGRAGIRIFMLHPAGRVSPVQERQMTTVLDDNVVNIAIDGTFDDAQRIVKEIFVDLEFRDRLRLGAVNSINWARVMAQIVYYFYAVFRFQERHPGIDPIISVPTGNFGDVYAGYLAKRMGLGIERLVIATNENDILARTLESGRYRPSAVTPTISPSMDIQVASNFERFLFDLCGRDGARVRAKMTALHDGGEFTLSSGQLAEARRWFAGVRVDTGAALACMREMATRGVEIDPHTAVGVAAARQVTDGPAICLATAHPAKFPDAFKRATGRSPATPKAISELASLPARCRRGDARVDAIKGIIVRTVHG